MHDPDLRGVLVRSRLDGSDFTGALLDRSTFAECSLAQARLDDMRAAPALTDPAAIDSKRAIVEAALERARRRRGG